MSNSRAFPLKCFGRPLFVFLTASLRGSTGLTYNGSNIILAKSNLIIASMWYAHVTTYYHWYMLQVNQDLKRLYSDSISYVHIQIE